MVPDGFRHIELHLSEKLPVAVHHLGIQDARHMEDHIVISLVLVMSMNIPVARLVVDLHIPHPKRPSDLDLRIEEIRTRIAIMQTRVNHLDNLAVARLQLPQWEQFVLKHIVQ